MVIGHGMIAKRFEVYQNDDRFVIFASGVSNSKNRIDAPYKREIQLLEQTIKEHKEKIFVYFSTCSLYDPEEKHSAYITHKKQIEEIIQSNSKRFSIFRVSNLVGRSDNPNTVLNFFVYHIRNQINFDLWSKASRNLVDIDDMYKIVDNILQGGIYANGIINIANPSSYKVTEIVAAIENRWQIQANYIPIPKGSTFDIDISGISPIIKKLEIHFDDNYLVNLLEKYY
ncbi:MAG: NAD-dependent epimerase/dehydratase family protein [Bacteroidetes bacterium]|nr:MAG: NAD-dependent epimerase/dehydratase family protein [Bacteroidota bacterium]